MYKKARYIISMIVCCLFVTCFASTPGFADEEPVTGYWQFTNSIQDVPICGRVLLSHSVAPSHIFGGASSFVEDSEFLKVLDKKELQYKNPQLDGLMLIQNGQMFYIQLADGTYLKRDSDLTAPTLEMTENIDDATLFRIEMAGRKVNDTVCFRIYEPYQLSNLYLYVDGESLSLHHTNYSTFYMLAETTKAKKPLLGKFTGLVRLFVIVAALALIYFLASLLRKKKLSFVNFGISLIAVGIFLFSFLLIANTKEEPGLYVLHQSTFEAQEIQSDDGRAPNESRYQILEDGSATILLNGNEDSPYIWGASEYDPSAFTVISSNAYTDSVYQIQIRGFVEGTFDMVFYYYDATKDFSSASQAITYSITVDANQKIISITPKNGEL